MIGRNYDYDEGRYLFFRFVAKEEEPPDTGGGRVFSLDAALCLPHAGPWGAK